MRILFVICLVLLVLPAKAQESFSNADLLRAFDIVAFGGEYSGKRYDVVRKWAGPVRIGIQGKDHPAYLETFIEDVAQDLTKTTGHPVELYYSFGKQKAIQLPADFDPKRVNVFVLYADDKGVRDAVYQYFGGSKIEKEAVLAEATCLANYKTRKNEIVWALIIFPSRHPESYHRACAVEEITQIMGLPNDSDTIPQSIFNDTSKHFELTEFDRWLLKALYQPAIKPNMPRNEALKLALDFWKRARPE